MRESGWNMSIASDERFTPQHVLDVFRGYADIILDPCSIASNPVRARHHFVRSDDGLNQGWHFEYSHSGWTFVNPPYSRGQLVRWAHKAHGEHKAFGLEIGMLVPSDMSTGWAHFLLKHANAVGFWKQRIRFQLPDGSYESGAKFGSAVYYFGERQGRFKRVFESHATVLVLR
jgi:hypothetical protein